MLIADIKQTPELDAEIQHVIQALPDDDLAALARTEPAFLSGGFRATNTAALRVRALQVATGPQPLSDAFRRLLVRHSLNRPLVGLLSTATLVDLRHDLAALFGAPRLLLAALLDERAEVRETAARWLKQDTPFAVVDASQAASHLRELFARLLEATGSSGQASEAPVTREAWQEARQQLEQQLRDARAETRRLKGVEERLSRTRDQLAARERELTEAKSHLAELETQGRQTARERDAARVELEREVNHREERLRAAVEARLAEEAAGWLATAHAVAAATTATAAPGEDVLTRADAALARQAAVDRHSGNRVQLNARLDALDARLKQARDLLANALQPVPELVAAEHELATEAERLRRLLCRNGDRSPLENTLVARFSTAEPNDLPALRSLSERLVALGGLDAEAESRLIAVLQRRQSLMRATTPPANGAQDEATDATTATGLLKRALGGRGTAVLLVDGHNVLFGLQGRYMPPQGAAVPTTSARERLVNDVVRLTGDRPTCRAWIVFDGPSHSESTAAPNVRVTYSGGEGEHRADIALLDNVRFFRGTSGTPVILVSNDMGLCADARRLGASTLSAVELGALL